jgi:hypothetical protein
MGKYLDDVLILLGCILILIGTYQLIPVATWFVGGIECLALGTVVSIQSKEPSK